MGRKSSHVWRCLSGLATLGPDPGGGAQSPNHASLIDPTLGNESCTADTWCTKSGFRFRLTAVCKQRLCKEFVIVGTPAGSSTGGRSFCSTSDGVVRFKSGAPLTSPVSLSQLPGVAAAKSEMSQPP